MARTTATVSFQALELTGSLLPASLLEEVSKLNRPKELLLEAHDYGLSRGERLRVSMTTSKTEPHGSRIHDQCAHFGGADLDLSDRGDRSADLERRARIAQLFLSGAWGVELETIEADQDRERQQEAET